MSSAEGPRGRPRDLAVAAALTYDVRRDGVVLATVDGTSFVDDAAPSTATYEVAAVNDAGPGPASTVAWQSGLCPPTSTTVAPTSSTAPTTTLPPSAPATAVVVQPTLAG